MEPNGIQNLSLRLLEPGDSFAGFSLGEAEFNPLKTFLKRDARQYAEQLLAKTYVWAVELKIVAYVTLVCGEIAAESETILIDLGDAKFRYNHFPAIKIARLAVSNKYRKDEGGNSLNLGRKLVEFSLVRAKEIAEIAGCRIVMVDAKKPSVGFYEKCGFRSLNTDENRARNEPLMFIDLKTT